MKPEDMKPIELVSGEAEEAETVPLFYIDGKEYRARTSVPFSITLKANRKFASEGETAANIFCIIQVIGEAAWEALENFEEITEEQFLGIVEYATTVVSPGKAAGNRAAKRASAKQKRPS